MTLRVTGRPDEAQAAPMAASGLVWLPLAAGVLLLDQWAKWQVVSHLTPYRSVPVLPPVLDLTLMYNSGTAFGFLDGAPRWHSGLLIALALGVGAWIVHALRSLEARREAALAISGALILGGALGNVADRLRLGRVVDFIDAHWQDHHFWAFNVADSAITAGAVIYLTLQLAVRHGRGERA